MEVEAYILDNLKAGLILGNNDIHHCSIDLLTNGTMHIDGIELQVGYIGNKVNYHVFIEHQGKCTNLYTKQACFSRQKQGILGAKMNIESKAYRSTNWCKNCMPLVPQFASNAHLIRGTAHLISRRRALGSKAESKTTAPRHLIRPWRAL